MQAKWKIFFVSCGLGILLTTGIAVSGIRNANREAKKFSDNAIIDITKDWDDQQLIQRASPELLKSTNPENIHKYFLLMSHLGHIKTFEGTSGGINYGFSFEGKSSTTAHYVGAVEFEHGKVNFEVDLIRSVGGWKVSAIHIDKIL